MAVGILNYLRKPLPTQISTPTCNDKYKFLWIKWGSREREQSLVLKLHCAFPNLPKNTNQICIIISVIESIYGKIWLFPIDRLYIEKRKHFFFCDCETKSENLKRVFHISFQFSIPIRFAIPKLRWDVLTLNSRCFWQTLKMKTERKPIYLQFEITVKLDTYIENLDPFFFFPFLLFNAPNGG